MEGRDTWKALQAKLALGRERLDAKDYAAALEAVQAALAIDPDFLAAHSLRQRIELDRLAAPPPTSDPPRTEQLADLPATSEPHVSIPTVHDAPASGAATPAAGRRFGALLANVYGQNRIDPVRPEDEPIKPAEQTWEPAPIVAAVDEQFEPTTEPEFVPAAAGEFVPPPAQEFLPAPAQEIVLPPSQEFVPLSSLEAVAPDDQEFIAPSTEEFTAPTAEEFVAPSAQELVAPSAREFTAPSLAAFTVPSSLREDVMARDELFRAGDVSRDPDFGELPLKSDVGVDDYYRDSYDDLPASRSTGIIQVAVGAAVLIAVILVDQPDRYPRLVAEYFNPPKPAADAVPLLATLQLRPQIGELVAAGRPADFERPAAVTPPVTETAAVAPAMHTVKEGPAARVTEPPPTTMLVATADGPIEVPAPPAPEPTPAPPPPTPLPPSASTPTAVPASVVVGDEQGVKQALQRYRSAYDRLDARLARTVWPSVNEAALARAFDSLQSQSLTFTACDVAFSGPAAVATCEGTMRYTPRVGSRDSRVEPHVWTFTLRKRGMDWQIDSVKAAR